MTIGIDASRAARAQKTGTEQSTFFLLCALLELPEAKTHQFVLYSDLPLPEELVSGFDHVEERRVSSVRPWLLSFSHALQQDRQKLDVLFVPSHVVPFCLPKRAVTMIHGLEWFHEPSSYTSAERRRQVFALRRALKTCETILTPSAATQLDVKTWATAKHLSVPQLEVISHGLPVLSASPTVFPKRFEETWLAEAPFVFSLGTQNARKNLPFLVRAFLRAFPDPQGPVLVLAGREGNGTPTLQQTLLDLPSALQGRVVMLSRISEQEKSWFLYHARLFVFPSLAEGFGLPILEAWQAGCPTVVSDLPVFREVAQDAALFADPHSEDVFAQVLQNALEPSVRADLVAKGKSRLTAFSWERSARHVLELLTRPI